MRHLHEDKDGEPKLEGDEDDGGGGLVFREVPDSDETGHRDHCTESHVVTAKNITPRAKDMAGKRHVSGG